MSEPWTAKCGACGGTMVSERRADKETLHVGPSALLEREWVLRCQSCGGTTEVTTVGGPGD